jgi:hypothetical protein
MLLEKGRVGLTMRDLLLRQRNQLTYEERLEPGQVLSRWVIADRLPLWS